MFRSHNSLAGTQRHPTSRRSASGRPLIVLGAVAMILAPSGSFAASQGSPDQAVSPPAAQWVTVLPDLALFKPDRALGTAILVAVNISQKQLDDLASVGRSLEKKDPLAKELRRRQSRGAGQFGFDVGMGVAKGNTLPGPGKDRVGDALSAIERLGFDVAVKYSLERNNNLALAAVGAGIAKRDHEVQEARTADRDVFYWLGFDIATGIYGDPALGAQGNTATGPGAFKIRDALSPAGQRGFNDSVAFHLARSY